MEIKGTAAQKLEARLRAGCLQNVWGFRLTVQEFSGLILQDFQLQCFGVELFGC